MDDKAPLPTSPPSEHVVKRDGDRDLAFAGWMLSSNSDTRQQGPNRRGTDVTIYLTAGRKIVTAVHQWMRPESKPDSFRAAVHDSPGAAVRWLADDAGGTLGPTSKRAFEEACTAWPGLAGDGVERVE